MNAAGSGHAAYATRTTKLPPSPLRGHAAPPLRFAATESFENLRRAIWLGCARKYIAMLNGQPPAPIASLGHFIALLDEVAQAPVTDAYWDHVRKKMETLERRWRQTSPPAASAGR